jgi:hypothetical protein
LFFFLNFDLLILQTAADERQITLGCFDKMNFTILLQITDWNLKTGGDFVRRESRHYRLTVHAKKRNLFSALADNRYFVPFNRNFGSSHFVRHNVLFFCPAAFFC